MYEKAFSAVGARDWFHFQQWESMIDEFGLSKSDSLWVIEQVEVKKFKYSVFNGLMELFRYADAGGCYRRRSVSTIG